jgi:hypothetical protein
MSSPARDPHHGGPLPPGVSPGYQLHGFGQPTSPNPAAPSPHTHPPGRPIREGRPWARTTRRAIQRLLVLTFVTALGLFSIGYALAPAGTHGMADIIGAWVIVAMCVVAAAWSLRSLARLRRR